MNPSAVKQTEAGFTDSVIQLARLRGWMVHHQRPARTARGWRSAVQGDVGFPDVVLLRVRSEGARLVVAELKVGRNKPTADQLLWVLGFELLCCGNVEAHVWRPEDWPTIEEVLA